MLDRIGTVSGHAETVRFTGFGPVSRFWCALHLDPSAMFLRRLEPKSKSLQPMYTRLRHRSISVSSMDQGRSTLDPYPGASYATHAGLQHGRSIEEGHTTGCAISTRATTRLEAIRELRHQERRRPNRTMKFMKQILASNPPGIQRSNSGDAQLSSVHAQLITVIAGSLYERRASASLSLKDAKPNLAGRLASRNVSVPKKIRYQT